MWRISAFDREGREVGSLQADRGEITIGREADRRLVLPSPSVSRRHAKLVLDGPQPYIVDEGSANGVLVNGVRINQPTAVVPGVRVDIAEYYLEFDVVVEGRVATPAAVVPSGRVTARSPAGGAQPGIRLVGESGSFVGRVLDVARDEMVLGRAVENDLVLEDASLSRRHCRVRRVGPDRLEIEDLNSSNGTYLNGDRTARALAGIGDRLRFGEAQFRVEGDFAAGFDDGIPDDDVPARRPVAMYAVIGLLAFAIVAGAGLLLFRSKPVASPPARDRITQIADQAAAHLKAGREKLGERKFDGAVAEFEQVLELDPANAEARRLKVTAEAEPLNDKTARQVIIKSNIASDRAGLDDTVRLLGQVPADSVFHDGAAAKVGTKLAAFGEAQCKAKRWSDCQWAICKAREIAPTSAKPGPSSDAALKEAEKKLGKEKTFVPCKP